MASKVGIVNIALSHIGIGKEVANLETEKSEEAGAARRLYDSALNTIVRSAPWPFLTKIVTLPLIEEEPTTEWGYSYRYPSDCKFIRRILSGIRNDDRQTRAPYLIAQDDGGLIMYTDQEDVEIEYTVKADNPALFPDDFTLALSYLLASLMAPRLTGGDQFKLGDKALQKYGLMVGVAEANAFNEEQDEEVPDAEWLRDRD